MTVKPSDGDDDDEEEAGADEDSSSVSEDDDGAEAFPGGGLSRAEKAQAASKAAKAAAVAAALWRLISGVPYACGYGGSAHHCISACTSVCHRVGAHGCRAQRCGTRARRTPRVVQVCAAALDVGAHRASAPSGWNLCFVGGWGGAACSGSRALIQVKRLTQVNISDLRRVSPQVKFS